MTDYYHYTECGLDNVFLVNGFEYVDTVNGGRTVVIRNIDGLHETIGMMLVKERKELSGKEFRFLRNELLLSQAALAKMLGVKELTVGRWEKGQPIPRSAEAVVRAMFAESVGKDSSIKAILEHIADIEDAADDQMLELRPTSKGWAPALRRAA